MDHNQAQRQLEEYLKSDEFKEQREKYGNSDRFKSSIKKIKRNKWKRRFSSLRNWTVLNFFNILSTVISIIALIIAILSYLE